jgi:hypothetical protein
MRTTFRCKPIGEGYQFLGGCLERLNPGHHFAVPQVTDAGHHRLLVNIETSAKRMQKFHRSSSAPLAWSPDRRNLESVLRGGKPPVATIRGAQGVPGPIVTRADAHQTHTISMATTRKHSTPTRLHVSSIAGRKHRWGTVTNSTKRYLGSEQEIVAAVNDNWGFRAGTVNGVWQRFRTSFWAISLQLVGL